MLYLSLASILKSTKLKKKFTGSRTKKMSDIVICSNFY